MNRKDVDSPFEPRRATIVVEPSGWGVSARISTSFSEVCHDLKSVDICAVYSSSGAAVLLRKLKANRSSPCQVTGFNGKESRRSGERINAYSARLLNPSPSGSAEDPIESLGVPGSNVTE